MSPSSLRRSASTLDMKGPRHDPNRKQTQATRTGSDLDKNPHHSSQKSYSSTYTQKDIAVVKSQETSFAPSIPGWAQRITQGPTGDGQGLIADYWGLIRLYLGEICAAVQRHPSKSPVNKLFDRMNDLRQQFRLWIDGEPQCDQRLIYASSIRNPLIIKLTVLTLNLQPGVKLYDTNIQSYLLRQTATCVSQAASLTGFVPPEVREERSPANIVEFLDHAKCQDLKARVNDLFFMLPDINDPFQNFEATEDQQPQIGEIDDRIQRVGQEKSDKSSEKTNRKLREPNSIPLREERISRSANSGSVHPNELSMLADSKSSSQSPDLTDSSSESSLSLDSTSRNSARQLTDTNTSTSTSKVKELDDLEPYEPIRPHQCILIRGRSGLDNEPEPAIIDTGCPESLITSSVVKKHDLETHPLPNSRWILEHVNKLESYIDRYVDLGWKLTQGNKWRRGKFRVVNDLPGGLHVLIGSTASEKEDIRLRARISCLVAFRKKNEDTSAQEQRQRTIQTLEGSMRTDQKLKQNQQRHADACESSETQKSQNLSLHRSSAKDQGHQQNKSRK